VAEKKEEKKKSSTIISQKKNGCRALNCVTVRAIIIVDYFFLLPAAIHLP
jgi:hypothetical protein